MDTSEGIVQTGWEVRSRDGQYLGTVVDSSGDSMVVNDGAGQRRTIPKSAVSEQQESSRLALLSIDSEEVGNLGSDTILDAEAEAYWR